MKQIKTFAFFLILSGFMISCAAKKGCPSNGKNVGAEKLLSGDGKKSQKAPKFRMDKF